MTTSSTQLTGEVLLQLRWTVPQTRQADFDSWYDQEHLMDMARVPGILGGRRFQRVENRFSAPTPFNCLTLYQLRDASALNDPAFTALSTTPSPWALKAATGLDISRTVYSQIRPFHQPGSGPSTEPAGQVLFHVLMAVEPGSEAAFTEWYDGEHFPALLSVPGVLGGRRYVLQGDSSGSGVHPEQADFAYATVYELASADVVGSPEFLATGRRTARRERLGDRVRAHAQSWLQVYPERGAVSSP